MPPATVTASLRFSVSVIVLPASRSPLEGDSTTNDTVGVVVSICGADLGRAGQRQVGVVAGAIRDGRRIEIDRRRRAQQDTEKPGQGRAAPGPAERHAAQRDLGEGVCA